MLFWHKYKTGDIRKYQVNGVLQEMSNEVYSLLINDVNSFKRYCNGVGSQVGFWSNLVYHFIPDFVGLINISGESDLHDVAYSVPSWFATVSNAYDYWREANINFLSNLERRITYGTKLRFVRKLRQLVVIGYYELVSGDTGWHSFMSGKTIDEKVNIETEYKRLKEFDMNYPHRVGIDGSKYFLNEIPKKVEGYMRTNDPRKWVKVPDAPIKSSVQRSNQGSKSSSVLQRQKVVRSGEIAKTQDSLDI